MAYNKTNWVNGSAPALDAEHLNKIESQLELLTSAVEALPAKIQAGSIAGTSTGANAYVDVPVTFPTAFDDVPTVVVGLRSTSTAGAIGSISVAVASVTVNGFTARFFNAGSSTRIPEARWIAVKL